MTYVETQPPAAPAPEPVLRPAPAPRRPLGSTAKLLIAIGAAVLIAVVFFIGGFAVGHAVGNHQNQRGFGQSQQFGNQQGSQGQRGFGDRGNQQGQPGFGPGQQGGQQAPGSQTQQGQQSLPGGSTTQQGGTAQQPVAPSGAPSVAPSSGV